ncbi:MAG: hypothetical protein HHJ11_12575 [Phycicoccus sp.]|nr:hypothetical protein [Phycicoccus sp.]NMM35094.1 hypothetical protein [Phycicoccus sp.]
MQPSGLIFLIIIAIWAAYLLQHWVGRREHLATARSVDRFSEAMRVLERRTPLPESDLSLPTPRSYAVSPARPSRAEVVVKRAQPPAPNVRARPAAASPKRASDARRGLQARRVRGLTLLALLSLVVVVPALAAFAVLPWWSVLLVVAALVVDVAWLRHAAVADRAERRANALGRSASRPARSAAPARAAARPQAQVDTPAASSDDTANEIADPSESVSHTQSPSQSQAVSPSQADVDLSGWAPVPVPPPTYTLKARAERPQPVPAAVSEPGVTSPSSFDGLVDEGELDEVLDRRHA